MIKAPDDLYAMYKTDKGMEIGEKVLAFQEDGQAMVLDLIHGRLVPVRSVPLDFLRLEFTE